MTIFRITAVTPEEGKVIYDVMDQDTARKLHSHLLGRQLKKDGTTSVTVSVVWPHPALY
jgi:hypothetical protein